VDITLITARRSSSASPATRPIRSRNSHDYRPLGLGYANLGALLMAEGLPYDSDAGRAYAGAITSLMAGRAYHQRAHGRAHGPVQGLRGQREPMLGVIRKHRKAAIPAADAADKNLFDAQKPRGTRRSPR
jgi:ribonucleoside-diphosphate reductase alpha chain